MSYFEFSYSQPTKLAFGPNSENQTGELLSGFGAKKVMITLGGGSAKRSGLLQRITDSIESAGISYVLYEGCRANPEAEWVDAGAEVLLSQLFFDNEIFYRFHDECKIADIDVPVIPGVMPVINAAQIKRMVSMCNASFPKRFQKIISRYEDNKDALFDAGMSYCLSQIIDLLVSDISGKQIK